MFIAYLVLGALGFASVLYLHSRAIEKRQLTSSRGLVGKPVRDMWSATMLDCDYEATKHAFGSGRTLQMGTDHRSEP